MVRQPQQAGITPQAAKRFWQATLHRDARADGSFFFAVQSTQVYCRPSCPARRPLKRNTIFFRTTQDAEKQGFLHEAKAIELDRVFPADPFVR